MKLFFESYNEHVTLGVRINFGRGVTAMANKLSTFERRIEILFLLINSEKVTLSELSKRYSVHKNTVYNDIAFFRSLRSHPY